MPAASPTIASTQRAMHARRTRLRRASPRPATAEGTRSSGDSEDRSEETEVAGGVVSNNRFAVLRPREPAPGGQAERAFTQFQNPGFGCEGAVALPLQDDMVSTDEPSASEKGDDKFLIPISPPIPPSKRPSLQRLACHSPANAAPTEMNQQHLALAAASITPLKPQVQLAPLVLPSDVLPARSLTSSSTSNRTSSGFTTAAPFLSILAPDPPATLPSPPIPGDPMAVPSLGTLPIHPSLDFKTLTNPKSNAKSPRLAPPTPTSVEFFRRDDPLHHIVRTTSGRILHIAAEIAAANAKSTMRPVGKVLIPKHAKRVGEAKRKMDRKSSESRCRKPVSSPEEIKVESDEERGDGDGEEWLGKEEGFWK